MNVNCLSCGHLLDLRDAYDNYQGQVRCYICGCLLTLQSEEGELKSVSLPRCPPTAAAPVHQQAE
jgi:hypothetical protein